ncbi:MAG: hypothetical protein ABR584_11090 [Candidatus Baltobacteraceae bacterium]
MATGILGYFGHLVGAILCASVGLIIWDIGTRSPAHVLADAISAARLPRSLLRGILRFFIGLIFLGVSIALVFLSLPEKEYDRYTTYQIIAFVTALAVELLIGNDVRPLVGLRKGSRGA